MDDEVRVAADRRGEVAVGVAAEAGVADVRSLYWACFRERSTSDVYASRPCPRRAASRGDQAAGLGRDLGRLLRRRVRRAAAASGARAPCSCSTSRSTRSRVGLRVDPVDRRHPLALEQLRDLFVGEDHQALDQPVGLGLRHGAGADDVALRVEGELGLGGLDVEAGRPAALAERRRRRARDLERLGDLLRGRSRPAKIASSWS